MKSLQDKDICNIFTEQTWLL